MSIISRRLRWLQILFPPAEANPVNPSTVSEDIVLVHQVLSGSEKMDEADAQFVNGAAGVLVVNSTVVPAGKFWYVFATSMNHNDATARISMISIQRGGTIIGLALQTGLQLNNKLPVVRAFILPAGWSIRWETTALGGAQIIQGSWAFLELDIGDTTPRA